MKRGLVGILVGLALLTAAIVMVRLRGLGSGRSDDNLDRPTEEFSIGRGPRLALIPVTCHGKTLMFCVDTGAWKTVFDSSLQAELGQSLGRTTSATPSGFLEVELFRCPSASVGSLDLARVESVICYDLAKMRYASGQEIYGVLGMDFLKSFAFEFDFDKGKCRIWKSAPENWSQGRCLSISYDESNRPQLQLALSGSEPEKFVIDTGANASTLRSSVFDELVKNGDIAPSIAHNGIAMAGTFRAQSGYVNQLQLDSFTHRNIRLDRDPFSALGIRYLSRYKVRLDFAGSKASFLAGGRIDSPEPTATSGLGILQMNGKKVVCAVEPAGPAAALGIVPGDVIMTVAGRDANEHDMVSLHEALTREPGVSVALKLNRNGQTYDVAVQLESRLGVRR